MTFKPRSSTSAWICGGLVFILTSCAEPPATCTVAPAELPLGLYRVVERECAYPAEVPEDCLRTRYIELAKGVFPGVNKDDVGMATWSSAEPEAEHQLSIRDLRQGKFVGNYQYVVEYGPLGKEWLVVNGGTITDYFFIRHAGKTPDGSRVGETHFTLRRAERTDELDRLLRHPPAGE